MATSASPASILARRFRVGSSELLAGPGFNNPPAASEASLTHESAIAAEGPPPVGRGTRRPCKARQRLLASQRISQGCAVVPPQAPSRYGSHPQVQAKKQRHRKVFARRKTQAAGAG